MGKERKNIKRKKETQTLEEKEETQNIGGERKKA